MRIKRVMKSNQILKGFIGVCLLLLLVVGLVGNTTTRAGAEAETVDLNNLLKTKFDEWMAWLTRRLSLNGTTSDIFDYSRIMIGSNINTTLSFPSFLLALTYMFEGTNDEFYLSKLQTFIDGTIDNSINYVTVSEIGQVFFPVSYYFNGSDHDTGSIYPGIFGYIATKLFLWTGDSRYKNMADRIASESYDKLAVVKNDTDVAWSWAYYKNRDITNAKRGVNRQAFFAWFYALYGNQINSTFTPFVGRIINWIWRAQLSDDSLAYSISGTAPNPWYTAFSVWATANAHLIDPSSFSTALSDKIKNTLVWLNTQYPAKYEYQRLYFLVPALLTALKSNFFATGVSAIRTKSMLYIALKSMHFTNKGFISRLDGYSFGFRWHQLVVSGLFTVYPLSDFSLDMSQFNPVTTYQYATGKHKLNGWTGGIFASYIKDGSDYHGSNIFHSNGRLLCFNPAGWQPVPTSVSITNNTYYINVHSVYALYALEYYVYPVGVFVGDITGTTTGEIVLDNSANWRIRVANGSEWQLTGLTSGNVYNFGTKMLVYLNDTDPANRRSFFVKGPSSNWMYSFISPWLRLNFSQAETNYRIIYAEIECFGHLIKDAGTMFSVLESLADKHDTTQPVSFETSFDAYSSKITELEPDATWKALYESAQSSPVKLIGHNLPEKVSLTAWSYGSDKLTLSISAPSGTVSTTKVYVGDKGEPKNISGATTMSYNSETKIVTIDVLHSGPQEIILHWPEHTPPTTTINLSGVQGNNSWFTSNVTVTLTAENDISGVERTEYSFDNVTWTIYTTSFTIGTEGYTIVYYKSTDKDGNVETIKNETLKIDKTAPTGSIIINNGDVFTASTLVRLTLTANDATSSVSQVKFSNDGVWDTEPWEEWQATEVPLSWYLPSGDGPKTVAYQIRDNAGLFSDTYSDVIILDSTSPMGTVTINDEATYTTSTMVILTLSATDATSDVAEMRFSNDNIVYTEWQTYAISKSWTLQEEDGAKTVFVQYMDNAGLISSTHQDIIILDTIKPTANAGNDQTVNEDTIVTFDASASTDENGIINYTWTFTDVTTKTSTKEKPTYTFNTPGVYTVTLNVTDAAGNWATDTVVITVLDITEPVANAGQDQTVNTETVVIFDASSSADNVRIISFEWDFGDGTTGTGITTTHTYTTQEVYTVTLTVKDLTSNTATDTIIVTVVSEEVLPPPPTNSFAMRAIGATILAITIAVTATLLFKKRK